MGRSRSVVFAIAAVLGQLGHGQQFILPFDPGVDLNRRWDHAIRVSGIFDYNANTVHNELPLKIYNGGYLERDLRQRSLDALSDGRNATGNILGGRLEWIGPACWEWAPGWRPTIGLAHHDQRGLRFTKDVYELTFFGNARFEDQQAILAPSAFTSIRYQTLGYGMHHTRTRSYFRLDLVRGQAYQEVDIVWASLFTGEDGRVLRTALLGDHFASDTAGGSFDRTNGLGIAGSGRWNSKVKIGGRTADLGLSMEDFGFATWSANSVRIQKDTLFTFTGLEVDDLFSLDNVILGEDELLDTFGLRYRTGSFTRLLPFRFAAELGIPLGTWWQLGLSVEQRNLPGYVPQATLIGTRKIGSRTQLGATLGYGGFGGMRIGLAAKRRFGEHVLIGLSTPQVPAFVSGSISGLGAILAVSVAF